MKERRSIADRRKASSKAKEHKELRFRHADLLRNINIYSVDTERAERLKEVLQALYEANKRVPIIVEGRRDANALRRIGLAGDIINLHSGMGLFEFCEDIAEKYGHVI